VSVRATTLARIDAFLTRHAPPTPCVVIDLATVRQQYAALRAALPAAWIYYAVKANPAAPVIAALAACDIGFDLASRGEIERCRGLGIAAERFCFGNTIKRESDIAWAHGLGIGLFAFDSLAELEKLARAAPGARVSFHVGSQQTDPARWTGAIGQAAGIFRACRRQGLALDLLNLGGGLPAQYRTPLPTLARYAETIGAAVARHFGVEPPQLMIEPGRFLVGDAGLLRARVLLIARHGGRDPRRWIYLDAGRYNGLAETQGESIRYPIRTPHDGGASEKAVLAGPTCDSTDILYDRAAYDLPLDLAIGDCVDFLAAGAYTASYASVEFNGFPPLATHCF